MAARNRRLVSRRSLGVTAVLTILGLGVLVSLAPIDGTIGTAIFVVVVALMLFVIYLATIGEVEKYADEYGFSPAFIYAALVLLAVAWMAIRVGFLQAGR
jgi:hypothetical protein